jgi:hypothetical protein
MLGAGAASSLGPDIRTMSRHFFLSATLSASVMAAQGASNGLAPMAKS